MSGVSSKKYHVQDSFIRITSYYITQQMPNQQPTALMPTPTMHPQMPAPPMGGAQNQYAPPNMAPGGGGGFQQPGVPMSTPSSMVMSAPGVAPALSSVYSGQQPQQRLPQTSVTPAVAASGGSIGGTPMAMISSAVTAGGVVTSQSSSSSSSSASTAGGGGAGGSVSIDPSPEKKKKKKKVHMCIYMYIV